MGYIKKLKNNELVGGTDKTTIYPVTSAEAVFEEVSDNEFKSQTYLNNHITNERIVDNTIENRKLKDDTIDMGKLNTQLKTIIQNAYDASWKVKEEPFSLETKYDANDVVYDPDTNSSYVSLTADNQGNPVSDETKWRIIINGISAIQATEEIEATKDELIDYIQENLKDQVDDEIADAESRVAAAEQYAQGVVAAAETMAQQITDWTGPDIANTPSYVDINPLSNRASTAQIGYYTCSGGSGATIIVDDTDAAAFTPAKGGQIKILMTEKSAVTSGNVQLQFGSVTATKKDLLYNEETVSSNNTWELGEIISVYYDGTRYHASNAQGGSNKKINAYLYNDVIPLTVGQVYSVGESVKTTDKQLRVITKDITPLSTTEEYAEGDLKKGSTLTYLVKSPVSFYSIANDNSYSDGSFAIGSPAGITVGVEVENPVAGTITVVFAGTTMEIEVTSESDANDIAGKLVNAFGNQEKWALINNGDGTLQLKSKYGVINPPSVAPTVTPSDSGVSVAFVSGSSYTGSVTLSKYNGETWIGANNGDLVTAEILESKDEAWLIENATEQNSITRELKYITNANLFRISDVTCGSSSDRYSANTTGSTLAVTGIKTYAESAVRTAYFKLFNNYSLTAGGIYKISFDYSYLKSDASNKVTNIGFSNSATTITQNLIRLTAAGENLGIHYEAIIKYSNMYDYIVFTHPGVVKNDYFKISNFSIQEIKTVKQGLFENFEHIDEHETRLTTIEHTKAVELFDFDSDRIIAGGSTTAVKDSTTNTIKFTVTDGNNNTTRYTAIILSNGLIEGNTYRISFNYITTHTNGNIYFHFGGTSSSRIGQLSRGTGSINYNYTHSSGVTQILFEFYHVLSNEYAYINNLSIRLIGNVQEVADDFDRHIRANKKLITDTRSECINAITILEDSIQKNGFVESESVNNFTWYSYNGVKITNPNSNRIGIETLTTSGGDYTGYPQGFSIWGDYSFGWADKMPNVYVFNVKERRKIGSFPGGLGSGKDGRHANSVDFTNVYYDENDEFPLIVVGGNMDDYSGRIYLMRIVRDGETFTVTLIQTITVRESNTGNNGAVYNNVAMDRQTGKLWLRRGGTVGETTQEQQSAVDLFMVDLPAFKDSEGTIIPTATIYIDMYSPTYQIGFYLSPQGGCIRNSIGYFAYGQTNQRHTLQVIDLITGTQINDLDLTSAGYTREIEDIAFWGNHMITSGGGTSALYEIHLE